MGWFWDQNSNNKEDAVGKLDPSLKEFLEKEATAKYEPKAAPPPPPPEVPKDSSPAQATVPPQSLFQDGRYAHLWKNYEPLSSVEAKGKTDQEKLADLVEEYNYRDTQLNRAAQENCSLEWLAQQDCVKNGTWTQRMHLCRPEMHELSRCFELQGKMMKAMGYLSARNRNQSQLDRIQIHTDTLYRKRMEQDKAAEEAKEKGLPIPEFPSVLTSAQADQAAQAAENFLVWKNEKDLSADEWKSLTEDRAQDYRTRLKNLEGIEREVEVAAIRGELEVAKEMTKEFVAVRKEEAERRHARKEAGRETMGDRIKRWYGWN